jgi:AhpD family alkylhydroperoxidase
LQIPHCESAIGSTFSQINGCAYCIDMHSKDARAEGETEQRLYVLRSWRETPFLYRSRARGAGLDRRVTLITKGHVSDEVYEEAKQRFSDEELVNLQTGGRQQASFCAKSR